MVHRLDRETSGLMVYSKNIETAKMLTENWQNIITDRRYIALVEGKMEQKQGSIESWLTENEDYITESSPLTTEANMHSPFQNPALKQQIFACGIQTRNWKKESDSRTHARHGAPCMRRHEIRKQHRPRPSPLPARIYVMSVSSAHTRKKCFETPAPDTFTKVFESPGTKQ